MDDCLNFKAEHKSKKHIQESLVKKHWLLQSNFIGGPGKYQLWSALYLSKWMYSLDLLASMDLNSRKFLETSMYQSLKRFIGIKRNPKKKTLLQHCLGQEWNCY